MVHPVKRVGGRGRRTPDSERGETRPWLAAGMAVMIAVACVEAPHSGLLNVEAAEPPLPLVIVNGDTNPVNTSPSLPPEIKDEERPARDPFAHSRDVIRIQDRISEPVMARGYCFVRQRSLGNGMAFELMGPAHHRRDFTRSFPKSRWRLIWKNSTSFTTLPLRWIVDASNDAVPRINKHKCTLEGLVHEMTRAARIPEMLIYTNWPSQMRDDIETDMKDLVEKSVRYAAATEEDRNRMCAKAQESFKKGPRSCRKDEALWLGYFSRFPMCEAHRLQFCETFKDRFDQILRDQVTNYSRMTSRTWR